MIKMRIQMIDVIKYGLMACLIVASSLLSAGSLDQLLVQVLKSNSASVNVASRLGMRFYTTKEVTPKSLEALQEEEAKIIKAINEVQEAIRGWAAVGQSSYSRG